MAHWGYGIHEADTPQRWQHMADSLIALCNQWADYRHCYFMIDDEKTRKGKLPKAWLKRALTHTNSTLCLRFNFRETVSSKYLFFELLIAWDTIEIYIPSHLSFRVYIVSEKIAPVFNHILGVSELIFDGNERAWHWNSDNTVSPIKFDFEYAEKLFTESGIMVVNGELS